MALQDFLSTDRQLNSFHLHTTLAIGIAHQYATPCNAHHPAAVSVALE